MKAHAALLYLAASIAFAGAPMAASTLTTDSKGLKNPALTETPAFKISHLSDSNSPATPHLFPVNDEHGLLLTCVAPEIDTNSETDLFNNCTLAPGRTLDDVMHTFVSAIHYEQHRQAKERAEQEKGAKENSSQQAAQ